MDSRCEGFAGAGDQSSSLQGVWLAWEGGGGKPGSEGHGDTGAAGEWKLEK